MVLVGAEIEKDKILIDFFIEISVFAIVEPISLQPAPFPMVNHVTQVSHGNTLSTSQLRRRELKLLDDGYGKFDDHQERICVLYVCNMAQSIQEETK